MWGGEARTQGTGQLRGKKAEKHNKKNTFREADMTMSHTYVELLNCTISLLNEDETYDGEVYKMN